MSRAKICLSHRCCCPYTMVMDCLDSALLLRLRLEQLELPKMEFLGFQWETDSPLGNPAVSEAVPSRTDGRLASIVGRFGERVLSADHARQRASERVFSGRRPAGRPLPILRSRGALRPGSPRERSWSPDVRNASRPYGYRHGRGSWQLPSAERRP
jgi:hypothetical protein